MTNRIFEQESENNDGLTGNGAGPFSNDITEDTEDQRETMVPISELRKVRYEAAKYRKELQSLRTKIEEEKKNVELSSHEEIEKLRAAALKAENELGVLRSHSNRASKESVVINAASILGFCNPKDAISLIDFSQIEIDQDGNIDEGTTFELVKNLGDSKPYLKREPSKTYYGPTNPAPSKGNWPKPKSANSSQIEQLKYQARDLARQGKILEATKLFNRAWEAENAVKR